MYQIWIDIWQLDVYSMMVFFIFFFQEILNPPPHQQKLLMEKLSQRKSKDRLNCVVH